MTPKNNNTTQKACRTITQCREVQYLASRLLLLCHTTSKDYSIYHDAYWDRILLVEYSTCINTRTIELENQISGYWENIPSTFDTSTNVCDNVNLYEPRTVASEKGELIVDRFIGLSVCGSRSQAKDHGERTVRRCARPAYLYTRIAAPPIKIFERDFGVRKQAKGIWSPYEPHI